jgi:SAM-dependent methyltransferase
MFELDHKFSSFEDWMLWASRNRFFSDARYSSDLAQRIIGQGFIEPLTGSVVKPSDIVPDSTGNWREGLIAFGKNSRIRAVLRLIEQQLEGHQPTRVTIYAPEAVTALALCLRGRFPRFLGSEYASTVATRDDLYPIPHEDLTCLTLRSDAFDLVTTNEVLEHVPSIDAALAETARILKPGGWHIGTHPFMFMNEKGVVRAEIVGGELKFLMEPEYHGNPVGSPSLVFETPGWDILHRARSAGFSSVYMRFVASERYGYLTQNTGVFVLCCQK